MGYFFRLNILALVLLLAALASSHAQTFPPDGVAAIVNEDVITYSQVRKLVEPTEQQLRAISSGLDLVEKMKEARLNTLKSLIERSLIIQDFKKEGYYLPDNIIDERVSEIINEQYGGDRNALTRTLQAQGTSMATFKDDVRQQIIVQQMRYMKIGHSVIVSPYRIEQYYQENVQQFTQPKQVKLRHIYIRNSLFKDERVNEKGEKEQVDPKFLMAKEIHQKILTGSDFADLARSYSEGTQRTRGGDWGWVSETTLRPELAKVAFSLRPGQISDVVTTDDGFHILMVEDFRPQSVLPMAEVRQQVEQTLLQEEKEHIQQEWLDTLRSRAFIKMF